MGSPYTTRDYASRWHLVIGALLTGGWRHCEYSGVSKCLVTVIACNRPYDKDRNSTRVEPKVDAINVEADE
jgi:hypothetical protein